MTPRARRTRVHRDPTQVVDAADNSTRNPLARSGALPTVPLGVNKCQPRFDLNNLAVWPIVRAHGAPVTFGEPQEIELQPRPQLVNGVLLDKASAARIARHVLFTI